MECSVKDPWFRHIAAGTKTVEGRIDRGKWGELRTGVALAVVCGARRKNCVVTKVVRYRSFAELLEHEGLARTLPGVKDVASGTAVYREFYPAELEREHGVVAIHVAVISAQSAAIHDDALNLVGLAGHVLQSRLIRLIATKGVASPVDVDTCRIIRRVL